MKKPNAHNIEHMSLKTVIPVQYSLCTVYTILRNIPGNKIGLIRETAFEQNC